MPRNNLLLMVRTVTYLLYSIYKVKSVKPTQPGLELEAWNTELFPSFITIPACILQHEHFIKGQEFKSTLTVLELPFSACSAIVTPEADAPDVFFLLL